MLNNKEKGEEEMSEKLLECRNLTKVFSYKAALNGVDLEIGSGKIIGLLGPNGSGKTTLIKIINGLIKQTYGDVFVDGNRPGPETKAVISYLPDKSYFANWMKVGDLLEIFSEFYDDFDYDKALNMCASLGISSSDRIKEMSKGTKEKVQLMLTMSRRAKLYLLDEPIAGVDPAARDFILNTIINNYNEEGTIIISTHLISDIEKILDEVVFIKEGSIVRHSGVDDIREEEGKSVEDVFKEIFRYVPESYGYEAEGVNRHDI